LTETPVDRAVQLESIDDCCGSQSAELDDRRCLPMSWVAGCLCRLIAVREIARVCGIHDMTRYRNWAQDVVYSVDRPMSQSQPRQQLGWVFKRLRACMHNRCEFCKTSSPREVTWSSVCTRAESMWCSGPKMSLVQRCFAFCHIRAWLAEISRFEAGIGIVINVVHHSCRVMYQRRDVERLHMRAGPHRTFLS
jgi:hypothetical protein